MGAASLMRAHLLARPSSEAAAARAACRATAGARPTSSSASTTQPYSSSLLAPSPTLSVKTKRSRAHAAAAPAPPAPKRTRSTSEREGVRSTSRACTPCGKQKDGSWEESWVAMVLLFGEDDWLGQGGGHHRSTSGSTAWPPVWPR